MLLHLVHIFSEALDRLASLPAACEASLPVVAAPFEFGRFACLINKVVLFELVFADILFAPIFILMSLKCEVCYDGILL